MNPTSLFLYNHQYCILFILSLLSIWIYREIRVYHNHAIMPISPSPAIMPSPVPDPKDSTNCIANMPFAQFKTLYPEVNPIIDGSTIALTHLHTNGIGIYSQLQQQQSYYFVLVWLPPSRCCLGRNKSLETI